MSRRPPHTGFELVATAPVTLGRHNRLVDMYVLSPFVWLGADGYEILLRAVPRRDDEPRLKMAEIWGGHSSDGLHFEMDPTPVIFPGPGQEDLDGCEDPTVILDGGRIHMWYTGWNQQQQTGRLLYASGADRTSLTKVRRSLDSRPPYANPKEATVARIADSRWRMFFEYADQNASRIGRAEADEINGPWTVAGPVLPAREGQWDGWHMSPGPIVQAGSSPPVMFYNGASPDAAWRIGWAEFDADMIEVTSRCIEPLIVPDPVIPGSSDIAFAASAIADGEVINVYYSLSDKALHRATLRRT